MESRTYVEHKQAKPKQTELKQSTMKQSEYAQPSISNMNMSVVVSGQVQESPTSEGSKLSNFK